MFQAINLRLARPYIHLRVLNILRLLDPFISEDQNKEDGDVDVWGQECLCTKTSWEEGIKTIEYCNDGTEAEREVSQEGLKR